MPEKEGDDEKKSTKSVVNKRQKQMMGEEGYDIARDMGKVKPSKDKKDATTMPPSKEMKKTQKVNKGPSAFERVKAKYGKSVMNVGKKKANEEFDLTQVAEALGGYITEVEIKGKGPIKQIVQDLKKKGEIDPQADKPVSQQTGDKKRSGRSARSLTGNIPPEERGGEVDKDPDTEVKRRELSAQQDDKVRGEVSRQAKADDATDNLISKIRQGKTKSGQDASKVSSRPAKRVRSASGKKPTGSVARGTYKSSPEGQKAYDAEKSDIEARKGFAGARTVDKKGNVKKISGLKDDETNKYVDRDFRQDRATDSDPWTSDTSSAEADNAKKFGTPVPPRRPRFNPTEPFQDDDSGLYTAPGGRGKDKGVPQKDRPRAQKPPSGAYSRVGGQREVIGKVDTKVTGGEYGKLRSGQTVDQSAFDQAQSGRDLEGNPLTTSQRKELMRRSRGVDSDSVKNVSKNLTRGSMPRSELETGGGFDTGRSGESITRRPSKPDASPNVTVNVNQPKRDIDVKKTAGQIGRKFSDVASDAARSQSQSMMGAMGGVIGKAAFPDVAGAEAGVNLARGDKLGAALSLGQSLGGSLGFAAGVANAIRMRMPNYKAPKPVTPKFDPRSGGKLAKQGQVAMDTSTGEREAKMSVGGMALGRVLRNVKNAAKQNARRATTVRGGRAIQVSAGK